MTKPQPTKDDDKKFYAKLIAFVAAFATVMLIFSINFKLMRSTSGSMEPTIMVGDYGVMYKYAYKHSAPKHGDLIVFTYHGETGGKRVIGTPGDTISFQDGYVYRNGKRLKENYLPSSDTETICYQEFKVPAGSVFVMGDNREISYDSRAWKDPYIPYSHIKGKILFIVPTHGLFAGR